MTVFCACGSPKSVIIGHAVGTGTCLLSSHVLAACSYVNSVWQTAAFALGVPGHRTAMYTHKYYLL